MMASYEQIFVLKAEYLHGECFGGERLSAQFGRQMGSLGCFLYLVLAEYRVRLAVSFWTPNGGRRPMHIFSGLVNATKITFAPF